MCGKRLGACGASGIDRACVGVNFFAAESTTMTVPGAPGIEASANTIRAESDRTNPAMARRIVDFPEPDGPNKTVQGWLRANETSIASVPMRWRIATSRRGDPFATVSTLSDKNVPPPHSAPIHLDQSQQAERQQHASCPLRRRIIEILYLV